MVGMSLMVAYALPDPEHSTVARELLVLGYIVAAFCWLWASERARRESGGAFSGWWLLGAILLFLLAINKQFNLRGQFEAGIRAFAKAGHWYDQRQPMQFVVAIALPLVLALVTAAFLALKGRILMRRNPLALGGWLLLLLYLALRQTQEWKPVLPLLDAIWYHDWGLALEVGGIVLAVLAASLAHPSPA
jgi:hypothetical protein